MELILSGSTGFIGQAVLDVLSKENINVSTLSRSDSAENNIFEVKKHLKIDLLNDLSLYQNHLKNIDVFIHCAGNASFGNGKHYFSENLNPTKKLIDLLKNTSPNVHFIFISTLGATDRTRLDNCDNSLDEMSINAPTTDYGRSKLACEEYIINSGLKYTILRPSMVVGKNMRIKSHYSFFFQKFVNSRLSFFLGFSGKLPYIHVSDLAEIIKLCINNNQAIGQIFFCNTGNISLRNVFKEIEPEKLLFNYGLLKKALSPVRKFLPFSLKVLFFDGLKINNTKIKSLGWRPKKIGYSAFQDIYIREKSRANIFAVTNGYTIVTGAASGLGEALALELMHLNRNLILIDKNEIKNPLLIEDNIISLKLDLSNIQINPIKDLFSSYDISEVYLCAGMGVKDTFSDSEMEVNLNIFKVNVLSRIIFLKAATQTMRLNRFGRILLVSSSSAFQALPYMSSYAASNAALLLLGEGIAKEEEVLLSGIQIMTALPGGMDTNFQNSSKVQKHSSEKLMSPEKVAKIILIGFNKKKKVLVISFRSRLMLIASKIIPRKLSLYLWEKLMKIAR